MSKSVMFTLEKDIIVAPVAATQDDTWARKSEVHNSEIHNDGGAGNRMPKGIRSSPA